MNRRMFTTSIGIGLSVVFLWAGAALGAGEDFDNLEFFLDQYLKESQDPAQRGQIMERYTIKALGLLYKQNVELIRLNSELLKAVQQLLEGQGREIRTLEYEIRELRNEMKARIGSPPPSEQIPRQPAK